MDTDEKLIGYEPCPACKARGRNGIAALRLTKKGKVWCFCCGGPDGDRAVCGFRAYYGLADSNAYKRAAAEASRATPPAAPAPVQPEGGEDERSGIHASKPAERKRRKPDAGTDGGERSIGGFGF